MAGTRLRVSDKKERLAEKVIRSIRADVFDGKLPLGAQLPTEPGLMEQFGVSRTVVREAIAELRAAGLVRAAHGKGMFVTDRLPHAVFSLSLAEKNSIPRSIELLEFRAGLEVEAAGLAAQRRTSAEDFEITEKNWQMRRALEERQPTVNADFEFHLAIARAANNGFFADALIQIGPSVIPRSALPNLSEAQSDDYVLSIAAEHDAIAEAITRQDPEEARRAMRAHLENSQTRYRALVLTLDGAKAGNT